jgi:uncharacterized protein involved in type VI secretion and phage assembly
MSTQNSTDKKLQVNAHVFIGSETVDYVSVSLEQSFGHHHRFSVVTDYDAVKNKFPINPPSQIGLVGKALTVELQQGDGGDAYQFKGLITCATGEAGEGRHGRLVVEGYSPTILLERGRRWDVFENMELRRVVEEVCDGPRNQPEHLDLINDPVYRNPVPFLMQYGESDWEFLQRLSAITGERLYYTGLELVFGMQPREFAAMEVTCDREITNIRFSARYLPNTFTRYQYLAESDGTLEQTSPKNIENANGYVDELYRRGEIFTKNRPARTPLNIPVDDLGALNEIVMQERVAAAAGTLSVSGEAKTCHPRIGRLLKIKFPEGMSELDELGTYRVIRVKHAIDQNHRYRCEFEAVPAGLKHAPIPELKIPAAGPVSAVVASSEDPKGQGRVRVDFPFALDRKSEVWLRVMTPDAGSSDGVVKNRGMVFIPEPGDHVMVGFEFGDPNRPYVMGSLFHGKNAAGGGEKNLRKSITTRSGSTLAFEDMEDEEKYCIIIQHNAENAITVTVEKDKGTMKLETSRDIFLKAPELIQLEAKQIVMKGETIQVQASDTMECVADKTLHLESADKTEIIGKTVAAESEGKFTQKGKEIAIKADSKVNIDGGGKFEAKAGQIKMNQ